MESMVDAILFRGGDSRECGILTRVIELCRVVLLLRYCSFKLSMDECFWIE